jgi:hypothetical protein
VIFITLMEICCWFLGVLWLVGVSLMLGLMIVLAAWLSSHMCLPFWSPLGCTYGWLWIILPHYGVVCHICLFCIWMILEVTFFTPVSKNGATGSTPFLQGG